MFDLSPLKILIILAVIMLVMGPDKLPEVAQRLGAGWRALKGIQQRVESEVREAIPDLPTASEIARLARSPVSLLNQLADRVAAPGPDEEPTPSSATAAAPDDDVPLLAPDIRPSPPPPSAADWGSAPDPSLN
ncbi:MAG TPA: twin-arginine translocase TatA/TatE family subunit [Acidimicrobiales bacterium]|nr:twin-arginine translocase TatA/TatE family subunit [Acidimicrobiales bacterium]